MASISNVKQDFFAKLLSQQNQNPHQQRQQQSRGNKNGSTILSLQINETNSQNDALRQSIINGKTGYDLRLFIDSMVANKFLCCICKKVCRDAQELSCSNAHIFCKLCIDHHFKLSKLSNNKIIECPIDHEITDSNNVNQSLTYHTSRFVNNHIKDLQVKCIQSHNNISCNWNGKLCDLIPHMNKDCMFNIIQCPFSLLGCPQSRLYKYQLNKHISNVNDCNKHIQLALQKIKNLQNEISEKSELNSKTMGQLRAIKAISKNKDTKITVLTKELDTVNHNHKQLLLEYTKMGDELENSNQRLHQFEKAVTLLKQTNEKLVSEIETMRIQNDQNYNFNNNYNNLSNLNNLGNLGSITQLLTQLQQPPPTKNINTNTNNHNNNNNSISNTDLSQLLRGTSSSSSTSLGSIQSTQSFQSIKNKLNNDIKKDKKMNNISDLEFLVYNMNLEQNSDECKDKINETKNDSNSVSHNDVLTSKRVLYEFIQDHPDLPKEFNDMAHNALLQPNDDDASSFVGVLLSSNKHPQFKQEIATIVQRLQSKK